MEIIDAVVNVFLLILHWRVLVCLTATALAALALVHGMPWFSGIQGLVLRLSGLFLASSGKCNLTMISTNAELPKRVKPSPVYRLSVPGLFGPAQAALRLDQLSAGAYFCYSY